MSFGFSVGDFIVLAQLASNVVQGARQACGAHDELTREVTSLYIVLRQLERETAKPQSILNSDDDDRKLELTTLANHCHKSLKVLSNILDKYNGLSEEKRRVTKFWKRVQFGNGEMQDLSKLRLELSTHTNVITLFLNLLSVGSLGKVEEQMVSHGEELRAVRRSVNWVTASLQASAGHREGSILTSYSDDDKGFWKEFRRKMVKDGLTSRTVRRHETLIMNYVKELGDRGALDELPPLEEVPVEDSEQDAGDGSSGVKSDDSDGDKTPSLAASNETEEPTLIDSPFVPEIITEELPLERVQIEEMNGRDTDFPDTADEQDFDSQHQDHSQATLQQEEQQRDVLRRQEERIMEDQRHGEWRQEELKEEAIRHRERRRAEQIRDEQMQQELREKLSRGKEAGFNGDTPTPLTSSGRLGSQIKVPRSVFMGNPDGSWRRVSQHRFDGNNSQSSSVADQNNTSGPKRATVEEIEDESLSSREYLVHEHADGGFWQPTYATNSLDFVLHHLETRGYDPTGDREEVIHHGDIFVVPRSGDPLYVEFGQPQFAYSQDGAQVAVTGMPRNLVVQDQGTVPIAPQGPNFAPQRSPRATDANTPQPVMSIEITGDRVRDYACAYMSAARRMLDAPPSSLPPRRKATESDARRHRIPPGYFLREWDPREEPIMILNSVFDSFSFGKWIYDWTAFHHGAATPIGDMAGELWMLLIQLSAKVKTSEECMPRIRHAENREMVEDFIEGGERLMDKLKKMIKAGEGPMVKAAKGKRAWQGDGIEVKLGPKSGAEFIDTIFGRDRHLEATEKWMASVRLWNLRFDANCASILRNPRMPSEH